MGRAEFGLRIKFAESDDTEKRFCSPYEKIVSEERALQIIQSWHTRDLRVVVADAVLDIPHYRHADYFLVCANYGDRFVLRLATDELIKEKKDPEGTIIGWAERAKHAAHYPYIDLIVPKTKNGWGWVESFRPEIIVNSTTSPEFIIKELEENRYRLAELGVSLIALDEFARQIPFEDLYKQCVLYNEGKFDKDKFSGSIIKEKIIERAIKNHMGSRE